MKFSSPLIPARLLRRYKRFMADVTLDTGETVTAHCPNPGSMKGCMSVGGRVLLTESDNPARKLKYTWELARIGRIWVAVNTLRTNRVVEDALRRNRLVELSGYENIRPEAPMGERRRVDFLLSRGEELCYVEVKNVTLRCGDAALFPDSVTKRGAAHLDELATLSRAGHRAVMLYLVNRGDCDSAGPAREIDPVYAEKLEMAVAAGVETLAYRARSGRRGTRIERRIPFRI